MINISIIGPAHRTRYWMELYNSIKHNSISFEIIFVTDRVPNFKMPPRFRYIYSTTKPVQCVEIAMREARGELIHWTADDTIYNPHAFEYAYEIYKKHNNYKTMIAFRTIESGIDKTELHRLFYPRFKPRNAPRVIPYGLISKKLIDEIGRCDRNFIAGQWENDLVMRAYSVGAKTELSNHSFAYAEHRKKHDKEDNLKKTFIFETKLLKKLWWKNGKFVYQRRMPFEPFSDSNLLTISQGNKGDWK